MTLLTDYTSYADAQRHFSKDALWALFDGNRKSLNIAQECLDRHPRDRIAVRIAHADGRDEAMSFGVLSDGANRMAHWLIGSGIRPGDRVALMLDPSFAFYAALFGAMKAGAVAVPLFTLFGPDGLRLRVDDCRPRLLLLSPEKADLAKLVSGPEVVVADEEFGESLAAHSSEFAAGTASDDMAMFQYTSGTTRELPEAVKHRHRAIVTVMIAALYGTGVRPGDRFMCPSSPAWGHGLWHGTLAPLALGVTIAAYAGPFDPGRLAQALREFRVTNLSAAATHYRLMKNAGVAEGGGFEIEKLTFTGEPIDSDTAAWAGRTFGTPVRSLYGTTELGVVLANYPGADDFPVKPGALGKPVPGLDLAVLDAAGAPCASGTVGEIMLRRRNKWVSTKDLGHMDEDGYFYHDGRADDAIISAGWTMSAVEIEDVLLKHPDVREAAAIGVADDLRGQVVKAFIVTDRPGDERFVEELQAFTRDRLSQHEYPRQIAVVDSLPKTPAGKVNRQALRDRERNREDA